MRTPRPLAAAGLVLGLGVTALAGTSPAAAQTTVTVTTEAELRAAFATEAEMEIILGADIELTCQGPLYRAIFHDVTILGGGHTITQGCEDTRIMDVNSSGTLTLRSTTLSGGGMADDGDVPPGAHGGAIWADADVTVIGSTFIGNSAPGGSGGAIYTGGNVTVIDSTFTGNHAYSGGAVHTSANVTIRNSTFTANVAEASGGAITAWNLSLVHATLVENEAPNGANIYLARPDGRLTSFGSIVANPHGDDENCLLTGGTETVSAGYNYSNDASCAFNDDNDQEGAGDPQLETLADNGGPTQTLLPGATSPLIDAITLGDCYNELTTDQRSVQRPQGGGCDIGAVEVEPEPPNAPPVADHPVVTTAQDTPVNITLTATDSDGDQLSYAIVREPEHGTLSGTAPDLTYTPATGYSGFDGFSFTVDDGNGGIATGVVSITVTPSGVNTPPVAEDTDVDAEEARPAGVTITASDPDGDELSYTVASQPQHGTVTGDGPEYTYTSEPGFSGTDTFVIAVCDPAPACDTAAVTVQVAAFEPPADVPDDTGELTIDPSTARAGDVVSVSGSGFEPGEAVFLVLYSEPTRYGTVPAGDDGTFMATITVRDDTEPGEHTLVAYGARQSLAAQLTVTEDDPGGDDTGNGDENGAENGGGAEDGDANGDGDETGNGDESGGGAENGAEDGGTDNGDGTDDGDLPDTGVSALPLLASLATLLLAGGLVLLATRRSQSHHSG